MRVTPEVKVATEKAIRAAARKLFMRKGLEGTNTREIAGAARVAVGTVFNYFPSKEALAMSIAGEAFAAGRAAAQKRLGESGRTGGRRTTMEEDLFTLVAADIRALEPIRAFVGEILDAGLSAFSGRAFTDDAGDIRAQRLEDAGATLAAHDFGESATPPVMHLYWSLYLGVLTFWAGDGSPKQEDTWALLDQTVRMFAGALRRPGSAAGALNEFKEIDQ